MTVSCTDRDTGVCHNTPENKCKKHNQHGFNVKFVQLEKSYFVKIIWLDFDYVLTFLWNLDIN